MPTQPTILVKKKDGTFVRMTMDEFKDYVRNTTPQSDAPLAQKATKVRTENETVAQIEKTPNTRLPAPEAQEAKKIPNTRLQKPDSKPTAKRWTKEDHQSPLEVGEVKEARKPEVVKTKLPEDRGDAFDAVIKNLKFPVADELRSRLKSLIVSRVKDIRSDDQVVEYATRSVANGGLGLAKAQAQELIGAIKSTNMATTNNTDTPKIQIPTEKVQVTPQMGPRLGNETSYRSQEHRPIMHDVVVPKESTFGGERKASVGPIEELQHFNLSDFRRLSSNSAQAGEILLEKFIGLKAESYLLFLKAVQAWYNSPLYRQYQQTMADAMNQGLKIKDVLGQMKIEEYNVIVKLCNSL